MATLSDILLLTNLATGESSSGGFANWGEVAVANWAFLEDTVGEVTSKAVTTLDVTLTAAEERSLLIKASGALTGNRAILTNDRKGFWFCRNDCTGAFTLTFKTTSGTGVVVPQAGSLILVSDGTNILSMGALPLASGATDNSVVRADGTAGGIQASAVTIDDSGNITTSSTDAGAAAGPTLTLYRNSATPAASDVIGLINFDGEDSAGNQQTFADIFATITDPTSGSEDATVRLRNIVAGVLTDRITLTAAGATIAGSVTFTG